MGGERNTERERQVNVLATLAIKYGVPCAPARELRNASRQKIAALATALSSANLSQPDSEAASAAKSAYDATFEKRPAVALPQYPDTMEEGETESRQLAWKFQAVQLTYNKEASPEWRSTDMAVLQGLFERFKVFMLHLGSCLHAAGVSVTMERGSTSNHVHCHAYLHLQKAFHRRGRGALEIFKFEDVAPHVVANTASGKSFMGAVRYGHFYVVVPKIGSLLLVMVAWGKLRLKILEKKRNPEGYSSCEALVVTP